MVQRLTYDYRVVSTPRQIQYRCKDKGNISVDQEDSSSQASAPRLPTRAVLLGQMPRLMPEQTSSSSSSSSSSSLNGPSRRAVQELCKSGEAWPCSASRGYPGFSGCGLKAVMNDLEYSRSNQRNFRLDQCFILVGY